MQPFPGGGDEVPLMSGVFPMWSADGNDLVYRKPQGAADVVGARLLRYEVFSGPGGGEREERMLPIEGFSVITRHRDYDFAPDGRILVAFSPDEPERHAYLLTNWFEVLKERVPVP